MLQTIIVLFAIAFALFYAIRKIIKRVHHKKGSSPCDGCSGCDLKNQTTCAHKPARK